MATFYVIRYNRTFMNSDMFAHIPVGSPTDTPLTLAGTYQGHRYPMAEFKDALFMTSKRIDKMIRGLVRQGFPPQIMDKVAIEVAEPVSAADEPS